MIKVGDVFEAKSGSNYTVVEYINTRNIIIEFNDQFKHQMRVNCSSIKHGMIKNPYHRSVRGVGYFGVGDFKSHRSGQQTKEYKVWQSMIDRCYSGLDKHDAYSDCTVSDDWHNFQNFAKWYTKQEYCDAGYDIDKDILITGNRVYSEEACCLVPTEINIMAVGLRFIGVNKKMGIAYNSKTRKYSAKMNIGSEQKHIGSYSTLDEACSAYVSLKKRYFKNMAIVYKDRLDIKVVKALWFWTELSVDCSTEV